MTAKVLCIFHSQNGINHCDDGFTAAYIVRDVLGAENVEFFPGIYQKPPPDVTGRDVIMVDFSYKRPVIDEMISKCRSLLILDHHKTAMADLGNLSNTPAISWHEWRQDICSEKTTRPKVGVLFDMGRSGAGMARDFFYDLAHGAEPSFAIDRFVDYIQDRDLWTKELPEGDQFTIALRSYPQDFETWQVLIARGVPRLIEEGRGIWRYYRGACDQVMKDAYVATIGFDPEALTSIWAVNAPYFVASEVAGDLAQRDEGVGVAYFKRADGLWQYSLRSTRFDVSAIAKQWGGGGHAGAAGFAVPEPVHVRVAP